MMPLHLPLGLELERRVDRAHQGLQLVVADLHEVIAGRDLHLPAALVGDGGLHLGAGGLLAHPGDELLHHVEGHVGLQQRHANVAQRLVDELRRQLGLAQQAVLGRAKSLGDGLQHGGALSAKAPVVHVRVGPAEGPRLARDGNRTRTAH